ncbi:glycosyltransferase family 4 protein [Mariniblastus sp.]|nr:glycosyltransferase family 4 protein [Mariniblastus sp.]
MSTSIQPTTDAAQPLQLKILSPRFWPYSGNNELALCDLAQTLAQHGHEIEVVSPGWSTASPASFRFRNFDVQRIFRSASAPWGGFRYQKNLLRYLNQTSIDGLIFFNAYSDFSNLAKVFAGQIPLIVRLHDHSLASLSGQTTVKNRQVNSLKLADRIFVETENTLQMLQSAGLPKSKLRLVAEGILPFEPPPVELASQTVARQAIGESHGMLQVSPNQPLLICGAPLNGDKGMLDLVQAWKFVLRETPTAKLWIISQGTRSRKVWDAIVSKQMVNSIIIPGQFDSFADVFCAADAYLHPLRGSTVCSMLTRAMMANLCPIVTEPIAAALGLTDGLQANFSPAGKPEELANVILKTIRNPIQRTQVGVAASNWAFHRFHSSRTIKPYLDEFISDNPTLSNSTSQSGNRTEPKLP